MRPQLKLYLIAALALGVSFPGSDLQAQRRRSHHSDEGWIERCRENGDRRRAQFCEERTSGWHASPGQSITVDAGPNGGVSVSGWDLDSVQVIARLHAQAYSDEDARALAGRVRIVAEHGNIRAEGPSNRGRESWWVSYEISVPNRTDLSLDTENGPVSVEDVSGTMRLTAQNGPLTLERVAGDVRAHAQNGPLAVTLEGLRWQGAGLDASTQNGPLVLTIPEGYNANLEAGTVNGPMSVDFPITLQGRIGGRRITTTLGQGGPTVRVVTTNGPAILRRS
jgi:hypothetical protein